MDETDKEIWQSAEEEVLEKQRAENSRKFGKAAMEAEEKKKAEDRERALGTEAMGDDFMDDAHFLEGMGPKSKKANLRSYATKEEVYGEDRLKEFENEASETRYDSARAAAMVRIMGDFIRESATEATAELMRLKSKKSDFEISDRIERAEILEENPQTLDTSNDKTEFFQKEIKRTKEEIRQLETVSPESWTVTKGVELKGYANQLRHNELVTTPYVEGKLEQLEDYMHRGMHTLIHGHLGTGKTELAATAAKHVMLEKYTLQKLAIVMDDYRKDHPDATEEQLREYQGSTYREIYHRLSHLLEEGNPSVVEWCTPLIVSGSKDTTTKDLYSEKRLELEKAGGEDWSEVLKEISQKLQEWVETHPEEAAKPGEIERVERQFQDLYKLDHSSFGTVVREQKKMILKAAEEGRPVIIDEANAIPGAVLISLNSLLGKKPGDTWSMPGIETPVKIEAGFSIILTGNISTAAIDYAGTNKLNPATKSRFVEMSYSYLPMGESSKAPGEDEPFEDELFHVVVSYLLDKKGNLNIRDPKKNIKKLYDLCLFASRTQKMFDGSWEQSKMGKDSSGTRLGGTELKEKVLSIRNILQVLKVWNNGEKMSLDEALWSGFIGECSNSDEKNKLMNCAVECGLFSTNEGWLKYTSRAKGEPGVTIDDIKPKIKDGEFYIPMKKEVLGIYDVVRLVYGEGPEREMWPEDIDLDKIVEESDDNFYDEDLATCENALRELADTINVLEELGRKCGCVINSDGSA